MWKNVRRTAAALGLTVACAAGAAAQPGAPGLRPAPAAPAAERPAVLQRIGFEQKLDNPLPLDATFRDEEGRTVRLGQYFGRRPVVVAFVYYECPMLCTQILNGLASALGVLDQTVGRDFDVVTISFDARETPVLAAAKKQVYLDRYKRKEAAEGWHFLTGDEAAIRAVTDAAGFRFAWDEATQQFAHASGLLVVTPQGRISRYLFGIEYAPRDLKFALMESSDGRIGSVVDQVLLYCYHYEPATGSYSMAAMNTVRMGGAVTLAALIGFVVVALRRETRQVAGH